MSDTPDEVTEEPKSVDEVNREAFGATPEEPSEPEAPEEPQAPEE